MSFLSSTCFASSLEDVSCTPLSFSAHNFQIDSAGGANIHLRMAFKGLFCSGYSEKSAAPPRINPLPARDCPLPILILLP